MRRVLITGANGFVGRVACKALADAGLLVRAAVRSAEAVAMLPTHPAIEPVIITESSGDDDWHSALSEVNVVVHLAARVHVMSETERDPDLAFQQTNVDVTMKLARRARSAEVSRFVFMSSIKVNGERTFERAFRADDAPSPEDAYARSKRDAEQGLSTLANERFDVVIVRPPLVYGAGVAANFQQLMRVAASGAPLPLGSIQNARSFISVWNLASFVVRLTTAEESVSGVWLISDGDDLSTPQLIVRLAAAFGRRARVFRLPLVILRLVAALTGKSAELRRLTDSLQIDSGPARALLRWTPPVSIDDGLVKTVRAYAADANRADGRNAP